MQTVEDIETLLPNGLHDAVLKRYGVDMEKGEASLYFDVWVGELEASDEADREAYRAGTLELSGVRYFVVEPPSKELQLVFEPFSSSAANPGTQEVRASVSLPEAPEGTFRACFFLYAVEAFIHVCASNARFAYDT